MKPSNVHILRKVLIPAVKYRKMRDKLISRSAVERVFFSFFPEAVSLANLQILIQRKDEQL